MDDSEDAVDIERVREHLETLEGTVDESHEQREVRHAIHLLDRLPASSIREGIRKFTRRDIAEAFVGSVLISLPLLVEDGVFDIAAHFIATPVFFLLNTAFIFGMTAGLLYYAEFRDVSVHRPVLGVVPRRLLAVMLVSLLSATIMMTLWGRVEPVSEPVTAAGRISVIWAAAAFGAALGDILPGESSGADISDELDAVGERLGIGDDDGRF